MPARSALDRKRLPHVLGDQLADASAYRGNGRRFEAAGLERIETRTIEVCLAYRDFADFWESQTPGYARTTKLIASMTESERTRVMRAVRAELPAAPGGVIEYFARANAIKARVPIGNRSRQTRTPAMRSGSRTS